MRIVSWNIQQGGGTRAAAIADRISALQPDVVGLSEFRGTKPSQAIAKRLADEGLGHQLSTADGTLPRLLLAARQPLKEVHSSESGYSIGARLLPEEILVAAFYVPPVSTANNHVRDDLLPEIAAFLGNARTGNGFAFGDSNNWRVPDDGKMSVPEGRPNDRQWFDELAAGGWFDIWRQRHPSEVEPTYYHAPGNGFRCDQLLGTEAAVERTTVRHAWAFDRRGQLSDHAAIIADCELEG